METSTTSKYRTCTYSESIPSVIRNPHDYFYGVLTPGRPHLLPRRSKHYRHSHASGNPLSQAFRNSNHERTTGLRMTSREAYIRPQQSDTRENKKLRCEHALYLQ